MVLRFKHIGSIALFLWFATGCYVHNTPKSDEEPRLFVSCNEGCDDGLECLCGVCTRFCDAARECVALHKKASCIDGVNYPTSLWCSDLKNRAICDIACTSDHDCHSIGPGIKCTNNFCRMNDSKEDSSRDDPLLAESNDSSQDDLVSPRDAGALDAVFVTNDSNFSMDAKVARIEGGAPDAVSEKDDRDTPDVVSEVDDSGALVDEKDARQSPDENLPISGLYGNLYSFVVNRQWDGSTNLSHLPWEEGWEELPEADFDSARFAFPFLIPNPNPSPITPPTRFALTISDDGKQITIDDDDTGEQMNSYTGTMKEQSDHESIYEVRSIVGDSIGRVRVWIDGNESGAELMLYGTASPVVLCQRGFLLSSSCESDDDCTTGSVCEPGPDCHSGKHCVWGCHGDNDCRVGETCEQIVLCLTCPCPAQCIAPTTGDAVCELDPNDPNSIDLDAFIEMANSAPCTENRNLLYMIDCSLIYWTWEGNCSDNGYGEYLFGHSPDDIYCSQTDSIAGPQLSCEVGTNRAFFSSIVDHRDETYLGLDWGHNVQRISF